MKYHQSATAYLCFFITNGLEYFLVCMGIEQKFSISNAYNDVFEHFPLKNKAMLIPRECYGRAKGLGNKSFIGLICILPVFN